MTAALRHLLLWFAIFYGIGFRPCVLASELLPEYTIKVGYLYNFALLTEWPENTQGKGDNFELCFTGNEDFGSALDSIHGKMIDDRKINVHYINKPIEAHKCQIIFLTNTPHSDMKHLELLEILQEIAFKPVLTVTDDKAMSKAGATIFLRPEGKRLVFEIKANKAKNNNLNISSRLLRLARGSFDE